MYPTMVQGGARLIGQGGGPHPPAVGPPGGPQFPAQGDGPQGPQQGIYGKSERSRSSSGLMKTFVGEKMSESLNVLTIKRIACNIISFSV